MPLFVLRKADSAEVSIACCVCIIGAGVAGLVAAARLARLGRSVVLLESGTQERDQSLETLNRIDGRATNDGGPRNRGIGGNSLLWAGKLLPFSPTDVRPRPYLDLEGWPLQMDEIERYRDDIETMMGVDHDSYEENASALLDPSALLPRRNADFALRWPKIPTAKNHDLAYVLRKEIENLPNLTIWSDATSLGFEVDTTAGKLLVVKAASGTGRVLKVTAEEFLITAGTMESTRLMLLLDRHLNDALSGSRGVIGRYFNDHLGVNVATLQPLDQAATNKALADRFMLGSTRHLHFELTPALQERAAVNSAYFDIGVQMAESSGFKSARRLLNSLRRRRLDCGFSDIRAITNDIPSFVQMAKWRFLSKQKYWPVNADMQIKFWIEQVPRWSNRLFLSEKCDELGAPMLKIEWSTSAMEEKTIETLSKATRDYWARYLSQSCALSWRPEFLQSETPKAGLANGHAHPAGSTRMGKNPTTSVVDPDLKVHGMVNVSVASASVFPTSGSANPTYTIMQVAMRAADAIARRQQGSR